MFKRVGCLVILALSLLPTASCFATETDPIQPQFSGINGLAVSTVYFKCLPVDPDLSPENTLQVVESLDWEILESVPFSKGFSLQECWFYTVISNASDTPLNLIVATGYSLLEQVDVTITRYPEGALVDHIQTGTGIPYVDWPIKNQMPAFEFQLPPHEERQVVWRLRSAYSLPFLLRIYQEREFYAHQEGLLLLHALFFGGMIVMIIYNLMLYIMIREPAYLLYVFWAFVMTGFQFVYWGFAQRFIWTESAWLATNAMTILCPLVMIFGSWFSRTFLDLKLTAPRDNNILKAFSMVGGGLLMAMLFVDHYYLMPVNTFVIFAMTVVILTMCIRRLSLHDKVALYFSIAWISLITGMILMALIKFNILPVNVFTENMLEVGTFLEVTLLSLALAERISKLKEDTERSLAEKSQAEFEASKARELSQSKSEFLAAMSHEIRTPMNGVLAMADLLRHVKLPPEPASYVDIIFNSTKSLLTVINDILDYSRIESGKLEIEMIEVDLDQLVDDCIMLFSIQSRNKGVPLITFISPDVPRKLEMDPGRVKQIINNLLGNAFKFTEKGNVQLKFSTGRDAAQDAVLYIDIIDTGIGLTKEAQGRLFQAFGQADRSIARRFGGTGLGLIISKNLAELMGGGITLDSTEGVGSRFRVTLPLKALAQAKQPQPLKGKRLLIAEPSVLERQAYMQVCSRWGVEVVALERAPDLHDFEEHSPHALLINSDFYKTLERFPQPEILPPVLQVGMHRETIHLVFPKQDAFLHVPVSHRELLHWLLGALAPSERHALADGQARPVETWQGLNVLVAEDNVVNQLVIDRLLIRSGIKAKIVEHGQAALDCALESDTPLDIVFMDCNMPVMDGYEASRKLRELPQKKVKWIIGLSANATKEQIEQAYAAGMDDYVTKPITLDQLNNAIRKAVAMING